MKKRFRIALALVFALTPSVGAEVRLADVVQILGSVTSAAKPIDDALVIALDLSSFATVQVFTGKDGTFALPPLRSSIYRLFAIKQGFAPAIATVLPMRASETITLNLRRDEEAFRSARDEIWAIRSALPPDVLRKIDFTRFEDDQADAPAPNRLQGQMVSMTAVSDQAAAPQVAQTMVGLQGDVGGGWNLGFEGNLRRYEPTLDEGLYEQSTSESQGVVVELRSLPGEAYRFVSTRSSWKPFENDGATRGRRDAGIEEHRLEWQNQRSRMGVQYVSQENMFRNPYGSERLEVSGEHLLMESDAAKFALGVRLAQENRLSAILDQEPYRAMDLTASGDLRAAAPINLHYGVRTRVTADGGELTPETSTEITLRPGAVLVVSGSYKVYSTTAGDAPGDLLVENSRGEISSRYAWSVGFTGGDPEQANIRVVARVRALDSEVRLLLDDQMEQIWEGLDFLPGDVWRDLSVDFSRTFLDRLVLAVAAASGDARNVDSPEENTRRRYVSGAFKSYYKPSGTSIDVSYRQVDSDIGIRGDRPVGSERVKIRMGQSLHLPVDLRLLVGVELAREFSDSAIADADTPDLQKRYLGGISFAF